MSEGPKRRLLDGPVFERLLLLAVVFMPFQYAMTLDVGFPLKISEILIGLAIAVYVLGPRKRRVRWDVASWAVFAMAITLGFSALVNFVPPPSGLSANGYTRGFEFDLALYTGYAALSLTFWSILRRVDREKTARAIVISIWLCGGAVALQWVAQLTGSTGLIARLGFRTVGVTGDVSSLRSGPFLEGQHLGFYAGAALIVALYRRSYVAAGVAVLCIVYSQSTTAYVGLAVGVLAALLLRPKAKYVVPILGTAAFVALVAIIIPGFRNVLGKQLAKLGLTQFAPNYAFATTSLDTRTIKSQIAFAMAQDHPLFGVGPGRFGAYFNRYSGEYKLPWIYSTDATRPIAENAYGHVASELGLFALAAFVVLIVAIILRNRVGSPLLLALAGYLAVGVATQSSWTFLPIWTFIALLSTRVPATPEPPLRTTVTDDAGAPTEHSGRILVDP
ncbi:hypothetical protein LK09_03175 [Microbacterium mangrovi]|uniref:O-antigen ligase-related domain-containing protein n=1 Tax=Microbacterium mangrovi TaxID=1348253 RepID=A0A0B2ACM0_9MICO|nr:O-antigen ligase family protein [Microbacterium mangrovi]KHK99302.1 hypothetical protein LK09_03175 [Microbacterium mangrovi]